MKDKIADEAWNRDTFIPKVGKRGAAIIEARGLSSAASAANAAIDHVRDWVLGTAGKWVTMGIPSDGSYGIPQDVMFGYPVVCKDGKYEIVQGLKLTSSRASASTSRSTSWKKSARASHTCSAEQCNFAERTEGGQLSSVLYASALARQKL